MADVWSGSIIYEWINEMNGYGLIQYGTPTSSDVNEGSSIVQGSLNLSQCQDSADTLTVLHEQALLHQSLLTSPICRANGLR